MFAACMIMSGRSGAARGSSSRRSSKPSAGGRVGSGSAGAISEWTVLGRRHARSKPARAPPPAPAAPGSMGAVGGRNETLDAAGRGAGGRNSLVGGEEGDWFRSIWFDLSFNLKGREVGDEWGMLSEAIYYLLLPLPAEL